MMNLKNRKKTLALLGSGLLSLGLVAAPLTLTAQDDYEYEWDEGVHEEEWYDPSDWGDTAPYTSTVDYERDNYYGDYFYDDTYDPYYYNYSTDYYGNGYNTNTGTYDNTYTYYDYYTNDWYEDTNGFDTWYDEDI
ncbi:MAG: hypothetical protein RLY93_18735 [Sumerlaeia bacterium]